MTHGPKNRLFACLLTGALAFSLLPKAALAEMVGEPSRRATEQGAAPESDDGMVLTTDGTTDGDDAGSDANVVIVDGAGTPGEPAATDGTGTVTDGEPAASEGTGTDPDDTPVVDPPALAADPVAESVTPGPTPSDDMLADCYAQKRLEEQLPTRGRMLLRSQGVRGLEGNDATMYGLLRDMAVEVAAGDRTYTVLEVDPVDICGQTSWSASELGVDAIVVDGAISQEAADAAWALIDFDLSSVIDVLITTTPYELYWYDKTASTSHGAPGISATRQGGEWRICFREGEKVTVSMPVSADYSLTGETGTYDVDPTTGQRVSAAAERAAGIAEDGQSLSAYARIALFKDEICGLVSYNEDALGGGTSYGDPWQLVYVFDGDLSTNVVCEGYSKAFQYLCDLAPMSGVEVRTVTGTMVGGKGAGGHMWNVVGMDDGRNYLVDVTNCDEGTVGWSDQLFLVPYATGTLDGGYGFAASGRTIGYTYDSDTRGVWPDEALEISAEEYTGGSGGEDPQPVDISGAVVSAEDQMYTGSTLTPVVTVTLDGAELVEGEDFEVSYADNVNAGTATVMVEGTGDYTGTATGSFTIEWAPQSLTGTAALSLRAGSSGRITARTSGNGRISYRSSNDAVCTVSSTGVVRAVGAGRAVVTVTAAGTTNYLPATRAVSVTVSKAAQSVSAGNVTVAMGRSVRVSAVASGGGRLTYRSSNPAVAEVTSTGAVVPKRPGKATVTVTAAATAAYASGSKSVTVTVTKGASRLSASSRSATVYASAGARGVQRLSPNVAASGAAGRVTYSNASSGAAARLQVAPTGGAVTVPAGMARGTYTLRIRVNDAGSAFYLPGTRIVTYQVVVR